MGDKAMLMVLAEPSRLGCKYVVPDTHTTVIRVSSPIYSPCRVAAALSLSADALTN